MPISADYITLQRQVADECGNRTDLLSPLSDSGLTLSPVKNAIQSAIAKWERESFYFNEVYSADLFSTVSGTEFSTTSGDTPDLLATSPDLVSLHILISSNRYPLTQRTWRYLEAMSVNASNTGQPQDWAYFAEQIRLFPIPDGAYPITLSGVKRFTALSANSDSNAWTTDAFDLIRSEAKLILAGEVLGDTDLAQRMILAIYGGANGMRGYLDALKRETARRARAHIKPTQF